MDRIREQVVGKRALAATPARAEGKAVPLRIDIPSTASIELWDSGLPVAAHAGDTLQTLAATYHGARPDRSEARECTADRK